jgi:allantoicase
MHYASPANLIAPGEARVMGEGWETARRRDDGNDWVEIALAGAGAPVLAEVDTSCFVGNAPGWARITGDGGSSGAVELLPRTRLQPDTRHRFRLAGPLDHNAEVTSVRLDIYPDGGLARLRLWGTLSPAGRQALISRWYDVLPAGFARTLPPGLRDTLLR